MGDARTHALRGALHAARHQFHASTGTRKLSRELPPGVKPAALFSLLLEFLQALPDRPVTPQMEADSRT